MGMGIKNLSVDGDGDEIIPANGGGPEMDGVFLSGYGDGDYTPRPRSGPLPSLNNDDQPSSWMTFFI